MDFFHLSSSASRLRLCQSWTAQNAAATSDKTAATRATIPKGESQNGGFILNRSPRKFEVRDFDVIAQTIKTNPIDNTTCVVFNPGLDSEAEATIVAGEMGFGQTTDEALLEALKGEKRIFANGPKLLAKVNDLNQHELDRLTALIKALNAQKDSIISTMKANEKKVNDYEEALSKSKAALKTTSTDSGTVSIQVEKA